ncbi:MAG: response regulator [Rhodospirillaceae bacterium]
MARILIIDDDEDFRLQVRAVLEEEGHEVEAAHDGGHGLTLQRRAPADLVITDIIMPNKEGIETIRDFQQEYPLTRIIAVTGGGRLQNSSHLFAAKELGASVIMLKPIDMDVFVRTVQETLAKGRSGL